MNYTVSNIGLKIRKIACNCLFKSSLAISISHRTPVFFLGPRRRGRENTGFGTAFHGGDHEPPLYKVYCPGFSTATEGKLTNV